MSAHENFVFRLYVAGDTPNSALALATLHALCRLHAPHRHRIELVDVFRDPQSALADRVFMTPTLVRLEPSPMRRVVGNLSDAAAATQLFCAELALS